jgi:hypothetical protein
MKKFIVILLYPKLGTPPYYKYLHPLQPLHVILQEGVIIEMFTIVMHRYDIVLCV